MKQYTKQDIIDLLNRSNLAVEKGIIAIYKLQTADEKECSETLHHNGIGFSNADANLGSYLANYLLNGQLKGRHLTGKFIDDARRITIKYAGQLQKIANSKLLP